MQEYHALLNILGLARRAGVLAIGQDNVFDLAKSGREILVVTTADISQNVLRKLKIQEEKGTVKIISTQITRNALGAALGLQTVQIVGIEANNGFSNKILNIKI